MNRFITTLLIGGPAHGQALDLEEAHVNIEVPTAVFVPPEGWTIDPDPDVPQPIDRHMYQPMRTGILGRDLILYRHERTRPTSRQVIYALLSHDGQAVYAEGWGGPRPAPEGPAGLLFIGPDTEPTWREVEDVSARVVARNKDGSAAAITRTFDLYDRWVRVAVPANLKITATTTWFDTARAHALLNPEALALWKGAK